MRIELLNWILTLVLLGSSSSNGYQNRSAWGGADRRAGLIGMYFSSNEFTNPKGIQPIESLEQDWHEKEIGYGNWSAEWRGRIAGPTDGAVELEVGADRPVDLSIDGKSLVDLDIGGGRETASVLMKEGESYPITVRLTKEGSVGPVSLHVRWSWKGREPEPIPSTHLWYTQKEIESLETDFPEVLEPPGRDPELSVNDARHTIVYYEPGRFGGWPANNGVWSWGDEILVGFRRGYYKETQITHSIDVTRQEDYVFARSLDAGESWRLEEPEAFGRPDVPASPCCPDTMDFAAPGFAFRSRDDRFYYSYDKGHSWTGPFLFPVLKPDLSPRTDYMIQGPESCLFFLSARMDWGELGGKDRAFCARTQDGGQSFEFLGWMTSEPGVRSVMPSTVRISESEIVSVLRRREDKIVDGKASIENWLDTYVSRDGGESWEFLSKVAETDTGKNNGNPPSLVLLPDGKLVVTYGYRATPYGLRAKISSDSGHTWGPEIALRSDARTWDFGYTRSVVRSDGRLVTVYYYTTEDRVEQHIEATIWDPESLVPYKGRKSRPATHLPGAGRDNSGK
jgi:hypothetical protein